MSRIVLQNKYSLYLRTYKNISSVKILETGAVQFNLQLVNGTYTIILEHLSDHAMPRVLLCNTSKDEAGKPHQQFLEKTSLVHLCLSVRDDISVKNQTFEQIIDYTLQRVSRLLTFSEVEERREFRNEFLYYWNKASANSSMSIDLYIHTSKNAKMLHVGKQGEEMIFYDKQIVINSSFKENWNEEATTAIYIPLINNSRILPPFEGKEWGEENLLEILNTCVSEENIKAIELISIHGRSVFLVFEMEIMDILPVTFLLKVSFGSRSTGSLLERSDNVTTINHLASQRCDSDYLFKRIGVNKNYKDLNVLLIGAGSLGSYVACELPKIGVKNITIFDDNIFSIENTMRHQLGPSCKGQNKALALKHQLELKYPELIISGRAERFDEKKLSSYNIEQYDLVILTTGNTDFMLRLNKSLCDIHPKAPIMYTWIEANGVGVHALPIEYSKKGCFQCLYTNTNVNKAHYGNQNSKQKAIGTGCGAVFNAYGNLTLLYGSTMILELIQSYFDGEFTGEKNLLYSTRVGDSKVGGTFLIAKRDFQTSKDFYIDEGCDVCGASL